jgi:hypothetical protein
MRRAHPRLSPLQRRRQGEGYCGIKPSLDSIS